MLEEKHRQGIEKDLRMMYASFNKPASYVPGALEVLMNDLEEDDLFELSNYMRKARSRSVDFGGGHLDCPRPIDIMSSVRAARKSAQAQAGASGCGCHDGYVRLYQYRRIASWGWTPKKNSDGTTEFCGSTEGPEKMKGIIADDVVTLCKCRGGQYSQNDPWFVRLTIADNARFFARDGDDNKDRAREWRDQLFETIAEWAPREQEYNNVVIDWPLTKGELIAAMVKKTYWPYGLSFFEDPKPEQEVREVEEVYESWKSYDAEF